MENNMVAQRIKELRNSHNLTQSEFAESINATQAALSGYERGDRTPSLDVLTTIAQKYNVSIDWLLGLSGKKQLSLELSTYTDLIKIIMNIDSCPEICKTLRLEKHSPDRFLQFPYSTLLIEIDDKHLVDFFTEWQEISSVRKKTPSGDKLYEIWLKDIYERFNLPLEDASQGENLPFN